MAQIQTAIFLLCIATVYTATITNISREAPTNTEATLSKNYLSISSEEDITDYNPQNPNFIVTSENPQNGFIMGKSVVEALLGALQILRHMDLSEQGLNNVSLLVTRMLSLFAGQYFETLKNLLPMFSGMAMAILESLK